MNGYVLRELLESGQVTGRKKEDVIASLTLDGFKHEFTLLDLEMLAASVSRPEMKRLVENKVDARLELIIKMYMRRYPYENGETNGQPLNDPGHAGPENV